MVWMAGLAIFRRPASAGAQVPCRTIRGDGCPAGRHGLRMAMDSRPAISCSSPETHQDALRPTRLGAFGPVLHQRYLGDRSVLFHSSSVRGHAEGWSTAIGRFQGAHGIRACERRNRNETRQRLTKLLGTCWRNRRPSLPGGGHPTAVRRQEKTPAGPA